MTFIADKVEDVAKRMDEIIAERWKAIQDKPLEETKAEDFAYAMYGYTPPAAVVNPSVPGLPTLDLSDYAPYTRLAIDPDQMQAGAYGLFKPNSDYGY